MKPQIELPPKNVDGTQYDRNGLRISYAKNYSTAYYNTSYVEGWNKCESGEMKKAKFRANVRIMDPKGTGNSCIQHLGVYDDLLTAAFVANHFASNYHKNLKRWQDTTDCKPYSWICPVEIPKFEFDAYDPETCKEIRRRVDEHRAANNRARAQKLEQKLAREIQKTKKGRELEDARAEVHTAISV